MADVLFYVQHLLGVGHLRRAAVVARALDAAGLETVLVSGGLPVAALELGGARFVQLPPLKSRDAAFSALVDEAGHPLDAAWKAARRDRLLALYRETRPRAVIFEQFPFGRRQLRFELLPLLEAAEAGRPRPIVLGSLRDIVNRPDDAEKRAWMVDMAARHFDLILVHSDPALVTLEDSLPEAAALGAKLSYTGYVISDPPAPGGGADSQPGEVLVSTGGGAVAAPLIAAALEARPLTTLATAPWRILAGKDLPEADYQAFRAQAPRGVTVERARPDFTALLDRCALSVSQAGYNSVLEVLRAGPPAVFVPFEGVGEREQALRAALLAERGLASVVPEAGLSGASLAAGIGAALRAADRRPALELACNGAAKTAETVASKIAGLAVTGS